MCGTSSRTLLFLFQESTTCKYFESQFLLMTTKIFLLKDLDLNIFVLFKQILID